MIKQVIFLFLTMITVDLFVEADESISHYCANEYNDVPEIFSSSMSKDCSHVTFRLNTEESYEMFSSIDQSVIESSNGIFTFPIYFSDEELVYHTFYLYSTKRKILIGEIGLMAVSSKFYCDRFHSYMPNYVVYTRTTLPFYHPGQNSYQIVNTPNYSQEIKDFVREELVEFDPDSVEILNAPNTYDSIIKKGELFIKYFWALDPPIRTDNNPPKNIEEQIKRLKSGDYGVLCAGMRDFLFEMAVASDSGLRVRTTGSYRFYYPLHSNIVVNSHALLEFNLDGKWWFFDMMHKAYFVWPDGSPMSVEDIAHLREECRLEEVIPIHIPTAAEPSQMFNPERNPFDPFNNNYFCHFNYFEFIEYN